MTFCRKFYKIFTFFALICFWAGCTTAAACQKRSILPQEESFFKKVTDVMENALPPQNGWKRDIFWSTIPTQACEGYEEKPIQYGGQFQFTMITELDRARKEMDLKQKDFEEKVIAAINNGDQGEVARLQQEMQQFVTAKMGTLQRLQQEARKKPKPAQMIAKFRINEPRKVIGKKFEIPAMAHTARTFERINAEGTERETITKMLYIGNWRVEDFIKNWNLFRPDVSYDKIGSLRVELTGKRSHVESYLSEKAKIQTMKLSTQ